jgi:hypothetical protein
MGYTVDYFSSPVASWLDQGWLKRGARLIDFGAQEFYCEPDAARASVRAFLKRRGLDDGAIARAAGSDGKVLVADKVRPAEFRAPFDHLLVADPTALGERLSATFSAYGRTRLTASVPRDPAGDALERAQEPLGARFARVTASLLKGTARSVGLTRARVKRIKVARRFLGYIDRAP